MQIDVPTSVGPGRLTVSAAEHPAAVLWMGHGAGGGIEAADLAVLASRLPGEGITVVRYEQPWRVADKRVAARPATLDVAWQETAPRVRALAGDLPLVTGGRSAGARVACRTATALGARGVVCLAFPLHPPGKADRSRLDELLEPAVPVLVVQGGGDPFGSAALVASEVGAAEVGASAAAAAHRIRVVEVPGADHGMRVPKASPLGAAGVRDLIASTVAEFVRAVV
ncbi:alpha/beta family hydrolase [Leifsonia sp. 1010]|uniref:alpha/beta hydrolase family protein n=1 Tax=Leifsonia sp. 1010 TaxID=2817769 RepID=UPI002860EBCE|nr:alpha/beta family hydrolase [Leifsonia sp. 1010]MDR6614087.1 putative alpha/beta-hydrolase family hydrolase [Leifsonia sp. 1010]